MLHKGTIKNIQRGRTDLTTQRLKSFITAAVVSLAANSACIPPSYPAALYEYDVAITGGNLSGHGSIGFNALTGNNALAPALEGFFFSIDSLNGAPSGQLPRVFSGAGDISSIAWSINPATFALQLTLDTLTQTDKGKSWDLSIDTMAPLLDSVTCGTTVTGSVGNLACYSQNRNQLDSGSGLFTASLANAATPTIELTPSAATPSAVPEPHALMLSAVALGALVGISRRRPRVKEEARGTSRSQ